MVWIFNPKVPFIFLASISNDPPSKTSAKAHCSEIDNLGLILNENRENGKLKTILCSADGLISEVTPLSDHISSESSRLIPCDVLVVSSVSLVQSL